MNHTTSHDPKAERERRLDEAVALYLREAQSGHAPPKDQFLAGYPDLTPELEEFIKNESDFNQAAAPLQAVSQAISLPADGSAVGDYELIEPLAQGGMGVVYRARQLSLGRVVALKLLRAGRLASPVERQRFRLEAEAVARLDHNGIVPVYDVGEHEGWLYFSMKLIEGGSLAHRLVDYSWPADRALPRAQFTARRDKLVELMTAVADAVHYAHQHGVLHRDLKPGNILLDNEGRPHVTDFGLAKYVRDLSDSDSTVVGPVNGPLTETGAILGTPSYMAPEQATGKRGAVATTTDVYSLGAILYELLTGRPPFREESPLETLRALTEREPPRPRSLRAGIDRDLETICLKCLDKAPTRRYDSAHEFAEDLRRCQRNEPILARPIGPWERVVRWHKRKPLLALLSESLIGMSVFFVCSVIWLWQRAEANYVDAREKEAKAEANLALADQTIIDFELGFSDAKLPASAGFHKLRDALLKKALQRYKEILATYHDDPRFREKLASVHARVGRVTELIGKAPDSVAAYENAAALYQELVSARPADRAMREHLAMVYLNLGALQQRLGRSSEAAASYREARQLQEYILRDSPDNATVLEGLTTILANQSLRARELRQDTVALALGQQALAKQQKLIDLDPDNPDYRNGLAEIYNSLFAVLNSQPDTQPEALTYLEKAREIRDALVKKHKQDVRFRRDLAEVERNLGTVYGLLGDQQQATAAQKDFRKKAIDAERRAVSLYQTLAAQNRDVVDYRRGLAGSQRTLGYLLAGSNNPSDYTEALKQFAEARDELKSLAVADPDLLANRLDLARTCFFEGRLLSRLKQRLTALQRYRESRQEYEVLVAKDVQNVVYRDELVTTLHALGQELSQAGQFEEGIDALRRATDLEKLTVHSMPGVSQHAKTLNNLLGSLGAAQREAGHLDDAVRVTLERKPLVGDDKDEIYKIARDLARIADKAGRSSPQRPHYVHIAVESLLDAKARGYNNAIQLRNEPAWQALRDEPDVKRVIDEVTRQ
jgi:serine/threonine protein kinase